ncbi:Tail Collar domain protein [Verrucomicrobia bacterium]|nr:Tail Collar domain protein [Verrucomicrobiota bacterium]
MSDPFVGEIRMVGFNFAPTGWALCNGQLMSISANAALFSLLGTTYGGDGVSTFGLPNLQGRVPVHQGTNGFGYSYVMGQMGGTETETLNISNLPPHNHLVNCIPSGGTQASPVTAFPAIESTGTSQNYATGSPGGTMSPAVIANTGSGLPFSLQQPYLCVNFIIALTGIYPARG